MKFGERPVEKMRIWDRWKGGGSLSKTMPVLRPILPCLIRLKVGHVGYPPKLRWIEMPK
ncbi:MAG: hypothetical protein IBJ13_12980 [Sphingopyxis sp.]|nr:hypothetical protein [Sphingopyxis sp.]